MLRAWLKRMDVNVLSARPHMNSPSYRVRQRRRELLAVELLENRITPSHLTIFSAIMPHGSVGHSLHANHGATSSDGHTGVSSAKAAVAVTHSVAHKANHATAHGVRAQRVSTVAPVSATTFTVNAPGTATAGTNFNVTVTANSANGSVATGYSGSVTLAASNGQAIDLVTARPFVNGVAVETVTLFTADTSTLTATASAVKGASASINVQSGAAFAFLFGAPSSATAGTGFGVAVMAKDASGNTVTGFSGNVTFASSDGQTVPVVAQTAFINGTAIFGIVLSRQDTVTLTAASGPVKGTSASISVKSGAAFAFLFGAPSSATAGTGFGVEVMAKDAYGNTITSFSGNVTFASSDGQTAPVVARTAFINGAAIFAIVLNTPDTVRLTAASGMISGTSSSVAVTVTAVPVATDWFSRNMSDPGLQSLARTDFTRDGSITYSDLLGLFAEAESAGAITSAELQSLQALVTPSGAAAVNMAGSVQSLTYKVVDGDPANAQYHGTTLGNLQVGKPASYLQELVDKWFLGEDTPTIDMQYLPGSSVSYSLASGNLFGTGGPSYQDVYQGEEGDCWLLASFAVTAAHDPSVIQSMFTSDGTQMENGVQFQVWTVRLYDNGVPTYLTVNNYLPASSGNYVYAGGFQSISNPNNVLWVDLAEKAYAQLSASGWNSRPESNAYASLNGGSATNALPVITGAQESWLNSFASSTSFINAINAGFLLTLGTSGNGTNALGIVGDHDYGVLGYNASKQTFTLLNPWGWNNTNAPGILNLTWTQLTQNFFMDGNCNPPASASLPQTSSDSSPTRGSTDANGPMEAIIFNSSDDTGHGTVKGWGSHPIA